LAVGLLVTLTGITGITGTMSCTQPLKFVTVGGTVTGLAGTGLVLQNNGGGDLMVTANGAFTFSSQYPAGNTYDVTVSKQPTGPSQKCVVTPKHLPADPPLVANDNVTSIVVTCTTDGHFVGGAVSGLDTGGTTTGVVLQNNGGDDITVTARGPFMFATPVQSGTSFAVTIKTQPTMPNQTCRVVGGTGMVSKVDVNTIVVECAVDKFVVGGSISGLATGAQVILTNNGGNAITVTANGNFGFPTSLGGGAAYNVVVATQPSMPSQTCTVTNGTGTIAAADISNITVACTTNTYTVGGTVAGLSGGTFVLQNNGADDQTIANDGAFTFATAINSGATYAVTVKSQPAGGPLQTCTVVAGSGVMGGANVTNVKVNCVPDTFKVGGSIIGLAGTGLVLQDNAGDNLAIIGTGTFSFTFATAVNTGSMYNVTVLKQPTNPYQVCTVGPTGIGTIGSADVNNVTVTCNEAHLVGGTLSGLAGGTVELRLNTNVSAQTLSANGAFTFADAVETGKTYAVTVKTQPLTPLQSCAASFNTGTVTAADVTSVVVTCSINPFMIGGTLTGLPATESVVLTNNATDDLTLTANGAFTFVTAVAYAGSYAVAVKTQPTTKVCAVGSGSGTNLMADVTNVTVTCL
jgi:hypothetical protein